MLTMIGLKSSETATAHIRRLSGINVTLETGGLSAQVVESDLALYLGSKLKLKQEEGL